MLMPREVTGRLKGGVFCFCSAIKAIIVIYIILEPMENNKREFWKFILQILVSILTAIATSLGATSCVGAVMRI